MCGEDLRNREHTVTGDHTAAVDDREQHLSGSDEQRLLWALGGVNLSECGGGGLQQVIDNSHEGRILGREVARKVRHRYPSGSSDLVDIRRLIPAPDTETQGGIDQPVAAVPLPHGRTDTSKSPTHIKVTSDMSDGRWFPHGFLLANA